MCRQRVTTADKVGTYNIEYLQYARHDLGARGDVVTIEQNITTLENFD